MNRTYCRAENSIKDLGRRDLRPFDVTYFNEHELQIKLVEKLGLRRTVTFTSAFNTVTVAQDRNLICRGA